MLRQTLFATLALCLIATSAPATLIHEWTFDDGTANDSVGTAHLSLVGGATISDGSLILPGGSARTNYAHATGEALDQLHQAISTAEALTFVFDFTATAHQNYSNLFMAGNDSSGSYIDYIPARGNNEGQGIVIRNRPGGPSRNIGMPVLPAGTTTTAIAIFDPANDRLTLWSTPSDEPQAAQMIQSRIQGRELDQVQVDHFYLGAKVTDFGGTDFNGTIDRVRLYDHAFSLPEVNQLLGRRVPGDTNLDDIVDDTDLGRAISGFTGPGATNATPDTGDMDGDGDTDDTDIALIISAFAPASAPTRVIWDGSTDNSWTNGVQNFVPGESFPANPNTGANWTIAGVTGQIPLVDVPANNANFFDHHYVGYAWEVEDATISQNTVMRIRGGSLSIDRSDISILPTLAITGGGVSALNLGEMDLGVDVTVNDSRLTFGRAQDNGDAFRVFADTKILLQNTVLETVSEIAGGSNLFITDQSLLTVSAGSSLRVSRYINVSRAARLVVEGDSRVTATALRVVHHDSSAIIRNGTVEADWIELDSFGNNLRQILVAFEAGQITLHDTNPLRDGSGFEGSFDFTGEPGEATLTHTNPSDSDNTLALKTSQGFFAIDGERIIPGVDPRLAPLGVLNLALFGQQVNRKYFVIQQAAGNQILTLAAAVPGDTDGDGDIDDSDLGNAIAGFTGPGFDTSSVLAGDADLDGDTDDTDLGIMISGFTGPTSPTPVPEPATLTALLALLLMRRKTYR